MIATPTSATTEEDEPPTLAPERRQRYIDGCQPIKSLPPDASDANRRREQRKCLSNARLAAAAGLMDVADIWIRRAAELWPVAVASLTAIKRSYERGCRYRCEGAERAATRTEVVYLAEDTGVPSILLTIVIRPGREPELRELGVGTSSTSAHTLDAAHLDTAISELEKVLARLRDARERLAGSAGADASLRRS